MATVTMGCETCAMTTFLSLLLVSSLMLSAAQMSPASLIDSAGPYTVHIACGSSVETYGPNGYAWQKDWGFTGGVLPLCLFLILKHLRSPLSVIFRSLMAQRIVTISRYQPGVI